MYAFNVNLTFQSLERNSTYCICIRSATSEQQRLEMNAYDLLTKLVDFEER